MQATLGVVIPVAQLLQNPSIEQLTQTLLKEMDDTAAEKDLLSGLGKDEAAGEPADAPDHQSAGQTLAQLDGMSDEEVEQMLKKLID